MVADSKSPNGKIPFKKVLIWIVTGVFILITVSGIFLYYNFNQLVSKALINSFNSTIASDIYELKFKDLRVNLASGNIRVKHVELHPREKPLKEYPNINSSLKLTTKEILLANVELIPLLKQNTLNLKKIKIDKPDVQLTIANVIPIFLPFKDSTSVNDTVQQTKKRAIEAFFLKQFSLNDASIHVEDFAREYDIKITNVDISVNDFRIDQQYKKDLISYSNLDFFVGEFKSIHPKEFITQISLNDYKIEIDSLEILKSIDTLIYQFNDFTMGVKDLDIQTADSIFHLTMEELDLSYKENSINLRNVAFEPNISEAEIQKRSEFQITQFSGKVNQIDITNINFDSLMHRQKLLVDEIVIDSVSATVFKDATKPLDLNRFPEYFGQSLANIKYPLKLNQINATNVNLLYRKIKTDTTHARVNINNGSLSIENISNINAGHPLSVSASASLEDKVPFKLSIDFDYQKPQFNLNGSFAKFDLVDLSPLLGSFAPVAVKSGNVEKIEFSGIASKTEAIGTMTFLYDDLKVDIDLEDKAKWKSAILSFAANTVISSANPAKEDIPPRVVQYQVERDMNKGFFNILLKSVLSGLKESVIMSKDNKKRYKEVKKDRKLESKK